MTIKPYRPNPDVRVEAMLFTEDSVEAALKWTLAYDRGLVTSTKYGDTWYRVRALEGLVNIPFGHYLVRGTSGEFYPVDPDVFQKRWVEGEGELCAYCGETGSHDLDCPVRKAEAL